MRRGCPYSKQQQLTTQSHTRNQPAQRQHTPAGLVVGSEGAGNVTIPLQQAHHRPRVSRPGRSHAAAAEGGKGKQGDKLEGGVGRVGRELEGAVSCRASCGCYRCLPHFSAAASLPTPHVVHHRTQPWPPQGAPRLPTARFPMHAYHPWHPPAGLHQAHDCCGAAEAEVAASGGHGGGGSREATLQKRRRLLLCCILRRPAGMCRRGCCCCWRAGLL